MKHPFRFSILPYFTMGAGGLGLCLRLWLFAATDEKGLLPASHPADTALYILTALTLGILFLCCRDCTCTPPRRSTRQVWEPAGYILGGLGLIAAALLSPDGRNAALSWIAVAGSILGGLALVLTGALSLLRRAAPYWIHAIITVALMLHTVAQCQAWGAQPQLQVYFFPLLAAVFSILTAYERTALAAGTGKPTLLAFFSQGAMFLCCLSLNTGAWFLYLGLMCWSAAQLFSCYRKKEA